MVKIVVESSDRRSRDPVNHAKNLRGFEVEEQASGGKKKKE